MARAAVPRAPRLAGAGAMHASAILARLPARALPSRLPLPFSLSVLLGAQAGHDSGRTGASRGGVPAAARAAFARLAQRRGRLVAVLMIVRLRRGADTSPRMRGEVEGAKRPRVRGPLSAILSIAVGAAALEICRGDESSREGPSSQPSPRRRGEGARCGLCERFSISSLPGFDPAIHAEHGLVECRRTICVAAAWRRPPGHRRAKRRRSSNGMPGGDERGAHPTAAIDIFVRTPQSQANGSRVKIRPCSSAY
jgi:hypothetical protein